ncbi:MAG: ribonuclease III [Clostridia bacterium]|nr:ribonuclease III [Clostridia bacterium]
MDTLKNERDLNFPAKAQRLYNEDCDVRQLNPLQLAFIGDVVFEIFVREQLICCALCSVNNLHKKTVDRVCCKSQSIYSEKLIPILTQEELEIFRKGKNAHTKNIPKNASTHQYHNATGLEAVFGYLYLKGKIDRLREIFNFISNDI